ncbi:MAG: hypothetical protein ACRDZ7_10425 [Acidimicrobiia bacterium]
MRALLTNDQIDEFLVQPLDLPDSGPTASEAGFCDGCSGCSVVDHRKARASAVVPGDEFLVRPLVMPGPVEDAMDAWCSGCAGCSAACRSAAGG